MLLIHGDHNRGYLASGKLYRAGLKAFIAQHLGWTPKENNTNYPLLKDLNCI